MTDPNQNTPQEPEDADISRPYSTHLTQTPPPKENVLPSTARKRRLQRTQNGVTPPAVTQTTGGNTPNVTQTPQQASGPLPPMGGVHPQAPLYGGQLPHMYSMLPQQQNAMYAAQPIYVVEGRPQTSGLPYQAQQEDIQVVTQGRVASPPRKTRMFWGPFAYLLFGLIIVILGLASIGFDIYTTSYNIAASITHTNTTVLLACLPQKPLPWLSPAFWLTPYNLLTVLPGLILEVIATSLTVINSDTFIEIFNHFGQEDNTFSNVWKNPKFRSVLVMQVFSLIFNIVMTSSYILAITNQNPVIAGIFACLLVIASLLFLPAGIHIIRWAVKQCYESIRDFLFPPIASKTSLGKARRF